MNALRKLYRGEQFYDFPKLWKRALVLSSLAVVVSLGALVFDGLNRGIEFVGGTSWEVSAPDLSVAEVRSALGGTDAAAGKIQSVGVDAIRVRADVDGQDAVLAVTERLADLAEVDTTEVSVTTVGPSWGGQITSKARNALIWFFALVAVYIAVRLEWKMAVGALVAVAHDIVISVGVYAVFQFEVTPATVIAFLTIMGYSLYDTIVVFDKVHEISGRLTTTGRYTYTEMMNQALNQVLMRSINTSITSILPVLSMLVVGSLFLGALTLQEFSIALLIGLIVGSYSSLFVAASLVGMMKEREPQYRALAEKVRQRSGTVETRPISDDDVTAAASSPRRSATGRQPSNRPVNSPLRSGQPPKPRKKKKR